ncbi:MAG: cupin domain-containing protein [Ruminococcus flavefaciens]|nr:cupin domain-containing protein [Ruminococcus flavefaciens]
MANYKKTSVSGSERAELHGKLDLTGAEISVNTLPAGVAVPFVHSHKQNEEIYCILEGNGKAVIDGETVSLEAGDWVRVSPAAKRQFSASAEASLKYACIQVKANSLEGFTADDAVIY